MRLPWLACTICHSFLTIFWFSFPLWLALLRDWALLDSGLYFSSAHPFSCYPFLPYYSIILVVRNGNGSGSGQVFPYSDPTRGPRPVAQTRPVYQTNFFSEAWTRLHQAPQAPRAPLGRGTSGPILWPNKKKMFAISRLAFVNSVIRSPSYFSIYYVTFSRTKSLIFSIVLSFYSFSLFLLLSKEDKEAFWDPVGLFIKWRSHFFL